MKSNKSVAELEMQELLKECEDMVDNNYLTTQDARKILDRGYKLLYKCEELRKSRDIALTRKEELRLKLKEKHYTR